VHLLDFIQWYLFSNLNMYIFFVVKNVLLLLLMLNIYLGLWERILQSTRTKDKFIWIHSLKGSDLWVKTPVLWEMTSSWLVHRFQHSTGALHLSLSSTSNTALFLLLVQAFGSSMLFQNIGTSVPICTVPYPRRLEPSWALLWDCRMSQWISSWDSGIHFYFSLDLVKEINCVWSL
jgi:hypothetical protein